MRFSGGFMIIEALALGLSTGTYCTMYCGPVLIPFLCGKENTGVKRNAGLTGTFLLGRLAMYFALGAVFGGLGLLVNEFFNPVTARHLSVFAYIITGTTLLLNYHGKCCNAKFRHIGNDWVTAALAGLGVGLHICPPLWTAIVRSVFGGNGAAGFFYLVFFYIGSIPFFLPLLGIPFITKHFPTFRQISRITQFLTGLYFLIFNGLIPFFFEV